MFILKLPGRHSEPCIKCYWHCRPETITESYIKILLTSSFSYRTFKDISNYIRSGTDNFDMRRPYCTHGTGPAMPKNMYKVLTRFIVLQRYKPHPSATNMNSPCITQAMEKY